MPYYGADAIGQLLLASWINGTRTICHLSWALKSSRTNFQLMAVWQAANGRSRSLAETYWWWLRFITIWGLDLLGVLCCFPVCHFDRGTVLGVWVGSCVCCLAEVVCGLSVCVWMCWFSGVCLCWMCRCGGWGCAGATSGENGSCCCGWLVIIDYAQNNSEPQIDLGASCNVTRVICGVASAFDVVDCVVWRKVATGQTALLIFWLSLTNTEDLHLSQLSIAQSGRHYISAAVCFQFMYCFHLIYCIAQVLCNVYILHIFIV